MNNSQFLQWTTNYFQPQKKDLLNSSIEKHKKMSHYLIFDAPKLISVSLW